MALLRKLFSRKPLDGLFELSDRVHVFNCCLSTEILGEEEHRDYMVRAFAQLKDHFPDASFMVVNTMEGDERSQDLGILSEFNVTVMDYPRQYHRFPILPLEVIIHDFLRPCERWLSFDGQRSRLLMHCETGGWPSLAFMLAALLLYRKQHTVEQRTLEMVYKHASKELLHLFYPLNPQPTQQRYLDYITKLGSGANWPSEDASLILDCLILRAIPNFDGEGGCRPMIRIHGRDPLAASNKALKVLFATPKTKKNLKHYSQAGSIVMKIDTYCHIQGDVIIECLHVDHDLEGEERMFRFMFNTAFVRSNLLTLARDEIDVAWRCKHQFPEDFKAEVFLSEFDAVESNTIAEALVDQTEEKKEDHISAVNIEVLADQNIVNEKQDNASTDTTTEILAEHIENKKRDHISTERTDEFFDAEELSNHSDGLDSRRDPETQTVPIEMPPGDDQNLESDIHVVEESSNHQTVTEVAEQTHRRPFPHSKKQTTFMPQIPVISKRKISKHEPVTDHTKLQTKGKAVLGKVQTNRANDRGSEVGQAKKTPLTSNRVRPPASKLQPPSSDASCVPQPPTPSPPTSPTRLGGTPTNPRSSTPLKLHGITKKLPPTPLPISPRTSTKAPPVLAPPPSRLRVSPSMSSTPTIKGRSLPPPVLPPTPKFSSNASKPGRAATPVRGGAAAPPPSPGVRTEASMRSPVVRLRGSSDTTTMTSPLRARRSDLATISHSKPTPPPPPSQVGAKSSRSSGLNGQKGPNTRLVRSGL